MIATYSMSHKCLVEETHLVLNVQSQNLRRYLRLGMAAVAATVEESARTVVPTGPGSFWSLLYTGISHVTEQYLVGDSYSIFIQQEVKEDTINN